MRDAGFEEVGTLHYCPRDEKEEAVPLQAKRANISVGLVSQWNALVS